MAPCHGRAVQVEAIEPILKAPGNLLLTLRCNEPLSNFASNFNLRRYMMVEVQNQPEIIGASGIYNLLEDLSAANEELDIVEKGLNDFLAGAYRASFFSST